MELELQDEADLFAYIIAQFADTKCNAKCIKRIPDVIRRAGEALTDVIVYRGQKAGSPTIVTQGRNPFFSVSTSEGSAKKFADTVEQSGLSPFPPAVICCLFRIHLINARVLDLSKVSFERAKRGELMKYMAKDEVDMISWVTDSVEKAKERAIIFDKHFKAEAELLVLSGGTFYADGANTTPGFSVVPDTPEDVRRKKGNTSPGIFETWYVGPPIGGRSRRTTRRGRRKRRSTTSCGVRTHAAFAKES